MTRQTAAMSAGVHSGLNRNKAMLDALHGDRTVKLTRNHRLVQVRNVTEVHLNLIETNIDGPRSRRWVLEVGECRTLATHLMARVGIEDVAVPYQRVRIRPGGSFLMVCVQGSGKVLLDGRWQTVGAGWACMAPPRVLNAFRATPRSRWRFCWVRYEEPEDATPLVNATSPVRVRVDVVALARIWEGLRAEWEASRDPQAIENWVALLHLHAGRLAQPWRREQRLQKFWAEIASRLAERWTLATMARTAHLSEEHLRRLGPRELGRSPRSSVGAQNGVRADKAFAGRPLDRRPSWPEKHGNRMSDDDMPICAGVSCITIEGARISRGRRRPSSPNCG